MKIESVRSSVVLRKRFCKDCNLPITVFSDPYFMERLRTLDSMFGCVKKFDAFCVECAEYPDEQSYFESYNRAKDAAINAIKESDGFKEFSQKLGFTWPNPVATEKNLYNMDNDRHLFVSIDMKKANFSAMRHYSKDIFGGAETWEEFMSVFTTMNHIIESKYVRQVICGACNPRKQITYEKYLMSELADHLVKTLEGIDIYSIGSDEIIIRIPDGGSCYSMNNIRDAVKSCPDGIGDLVRVEYFELLAMKYGWIKQLEDRTELKCVDSEIYHQVVKHMMDERITDDDLVFYHNGTLAKYLKEIENPWDEFGCLIAWR